MPKRGAVHKKSKLHVAAASNKVADVLRLLAEGEDINCINDVGRTPLMVALIGDCWNAITTLLEHGADVNALHLGNRASMTAAQIATWGGDLRKLRRLVKHGADLTLMSAEGFTCVHYAAQQGHVDILRWLNDHGCKLDTPARGSKLTALHMAATAGQLDAVLWLLQNHVSADAKSTDGQTAAHLALRKGHTELADIISRAARQARSESTCQVVRHAYARPKATGGASRKRLLKLVADGNIASLRAIAAENPTELLSTSKTGWTLLHEACATGRVAVVQWMLRLQVHKATHRLMDPSASADSSLAVHGELYRPTRHGVQLDKGRLQAWLDPDHPTKKRWTGLHIAANAGHEDVLDVLIAQGARPDLRTHRGETAAGLAKARGFAHLHHWLRVLEYSAIVARRRDQQRHDEVFALAPGAKLPLAGRGTSQPAYELPINPWGLHVTAPDAPAEPSHHAPELSGRTSAATFASPTPSEAASQSSTRDVAPPYISSDRRVHLLPEQTEFLAWLGKLRLSQYGDRLVEEGFDTIDRLACVEQGDLEEIGMRKGHIRQLMRAVELTTQSGTGFGATSSVALTASTPPSAGSVPVSSHSASTPDKRQSSAPLAAVRAQSAPVAPSEPAPSDSAAAVAALRHAAQFVLSSDEIRFKGCVGRGSFGLVHRGTWRGMEVAVKELDQSVVFANAPDPEPVPPPTRPALQPGDRQLAHDTYATSIAPASPPKVISKDQQPARWQTLSAVIPSVARAPGAGAERAETGAGNGSMEGIGGEDEDAVGARLTRGTYLRLVNELKHEAAVMARVCNHDHVVQFVGVITSPVPAIVTRFMSGGSLDHLMLKSHRHNRREHMTLLQTFRMLRDAAAGVLHLHHEGVIHRDLAARNLLLDGYGSVRVADFGFSRLKPQDYSRVYTRASIGPIRWMAPEAMQHNHYSERSDVYSFGVLMWEVLVGELPWAGVDTLNVALRVISGERLDCSQLDGLPYLFTPAHDCKWRHVTELMRACWESDAAARPTMKHIHIWLELMVEQLSGEPCTSAGAAQMTPARELPDSTDPHAIYASHIA